MFSKGKVLTRKQTKEICVSFKCKKNEFAVRKFEDGFLLSIRSKEYRVKFSGGINTKIVYSKEVQRGIRK